MLENEKKIVGFYVTGHPLDSYSAALENYTQIYKLTEASEEMDGKYYSIAGLISGVRLRTTKSGDTMAVLTLEDFSGRIEVVVFTRQYHEFSSLLYQENVVSVEGRLKVDERSVSLQASGVRQLNETGPEIHLKITRDKETGKVQQEMRRILQLITETRRFTCICFRPAKQLKPTAVFGLTPLTTDFSKKLKFCSARTACNNKETGRSLTKIMFMLASRR